MMGAAMKVYPGTDSTTGKNTSICIDDDQGGHVDIPVHLALVVAEWIKAYTLSTISELLQLEIR